MKAPKPPPTFRFVWEGVVRGQGHPGRRCSQVPIEVSQGSQCGALSTVILLRLLVIWSPHCELSSVFVCQRGLTAFHPRITAVVLRLWGQEVSTKVGTHSWSLFCVLCGIARCSRVPGPACKLASPLLRYVTEGVAYAETRITAAEPSPLNFV